MRTRPNLLLACLAGLSFACETPERASEPLAPDPSRWPPALSSHAMVYHDSLESVLVYGGSRPDRTMSDQLWGWDGERWRTASVGGPPPRIHAAVAYDAYRNRLVIHGGIGADAATLGDVWEWDGAAWYPVEVAGDGPGRRDHHAMAYDPSRGGIVLFGGQDEEDAFAAGTWLWDGRRWERLSIESPPPRGTHRLALDPGLEIVLLVGGWGPDAQLADVWRLGRSGWTELPAAPENTPGPSARGAHRYAFDEARGNLVLFGGLSGQALMDDTWTRTRLPIEWRLREAEGPAARNVHGMAYDRRRERVVLYGGIGEDGRLADLWEWDGRTWTEISRPASESPRAEAERQSGVTASPRPLFAAQARPPG